MMERITAVLLAIAVGLIIYGFIFADEGGPAAGEVCKIHGGIKAANKYELLCIDGAEYFATFTGIHDNTTWNRR